MSPKLDFDARVPIPFSVFPSSYRSDAANHSPAAPSSAPEPAPGPAPSTVSAASVSEPPSVIEEHHHHHHHHEQPQINDSASFVDREDTRTGYGHEEAPFLERQPQVELARERYEPSPAPVAVPVPAPAPQLDNNSFSSAASSFSQPSAVEHYPAASESFSSQEVVPPSYEPAPRAASYAPAPRSVVSRQPEPSNSLQVYQPSASPVTSAPKMGFYDDDGNYHSFRRGVERAADRIIHPFHHHHGHHANHAQHHLAFSPSSSSDELVVADSHGPPAPAVVPSRGGGSAAAAGETVTIPCHFIRIGDIVILQGRPCQVIRISVSPQTGQHRYTGVDLFSRGLQEQSSYISNPSPSVVVQTMVGPVFKTYKILDIREDNTIVAMTENGDVRQGLTIIPQGNLANRIQQAFNNGSGIVRAIVINDNGRELVVDYKVIHGSRL